MTGCIWTSLSAIYNRRLFKYNQSKLCNKFQCIYLSIIDYYDPIQVLIVYSTSAFISQQLELCPSDALNV